MRGRIGAPQRAMHIYYGTPLYNRAIMKDYIKKIDFSKNEVAKFRLEVINFYNKYGLAATIDAYGVSRATIFRYKEHPRLGKEKIKP